MYAARCPQCGRPGPVQLSAPDRFRCPACGYDGAPPAEVTAQLRSARAVLERRDVRARQLSGVQRRLIGSGFVGTAAYLGAVGLAVAPFLCCFWFWLFDDRGPTDFVAGFMTATPIVLIAVFGGSGLLFLRRRLGHVRASLAAFPPSAPGEPAGCHVCGGPVTAREDAAFARCPYCGADNLVDSKALANLGARRAEVLEGFASEVEHRAAIARQALRSSFRGLGLGALVAVPTTCCLTFVVYTVLSQTESEPYDELEYALVEAPRGRCVARVRAHVTDEALVSIRGHDWEGAGELTERRPRDAVPTFGARALSGLRVRSAANTEHGDWTVERVVGTSGTAENRLHLRADDGFLRHAMVTEVCLLDGVEGPAPPVPLTYP